MGTTKSRPVLPPPPKRRRKKKQPRVYEYFPPHTRLRPNSSYMYRSIEVLTSTGKAPQSARSTTSFDEEVVDKPSLVQVKEAIPRWQSKWEIDLRPDPKKEPPVKPWLKTPLPNITDVESTKEKSGSKKKPKRMDKKRSSRNNKRAVSPTSDSDGIENESFERKSVKSTRVDHFQMLHKTDDRSQTLCVQTSRLWNLSARRTSKFLSQDWNLKDIQMQEVVPVIRQPKQSIATKRVINVVPASSE